MYLRKIDIKGFKSFADHTIIDFQPGINIIVGPNGCGKSNVVDAIRWVLGEANIRNLRGQKSEDVIFNGTDNNRALGMANVEIDINNVEHILSTEFSEVSVARKLFRSGESEFYLNNSRVRLKDIHNLFTGTGLGKKGYSIIGQGELEQVLNGQGLERRMFLEEASGISKHRQQRDEVRRRIATTGEDLVRVSDLLSELRARKLEVEQKAGRARQYISFTSELTELDKQVMHYDIDKLFRDIRQKHNLQQEKKDDLVIAQTKLNQWQQSWQANTRQIDDLRQEIEQLREEKYALENLLNSMAGEIRLSEERIKNHEERLIANNSDEVKYAEMLDKIGQDLNRMSNDFANEEQKFQFRLNEYRELKLKLAAAEESIEQLNNAFEGHKLLVFDVMREETGTGNRIREIEDLTARLAEKEQRVIIYIDELGNQQGRLTSELDGLQIDIENLNRSISQEEYHQHQLLQEKTQQAEAVALLESEFASLDLERVKIENQLMGIKERQRNLLGYSTGVKYILNPANKNKFPGLIGVLGEALEVPAGMETAIEIAVGRGVENVVVEKVEQARQAIEILKQQRAGRVTFLPLDVLRVQSIPTEVWRELSSINGVMGLASQLVKYPPDFERAVEYLLGRILVTRDMNVAIKLLKTFSYPLRTVTLEGELFNGNGAITGGFKPNQTEGPLKRKAEENSLILKQQQNQQALDKNRIMMKQADEKLSGLEIRLNSIMHRLTEFNMKRDMMNEQRQKAAAEIVRLTNEQKAYQEQLAHIQIEHDELLTEKTQLDSRQKESQQHNQQLGAELEKLKIEVDTAIRDREIFMERCSSYQEQVDMKRQEIENMKRSIEQLQQVRNSYEQSYNQSKQLHERLTEETKSEKQKITTIQSEQEKNTAQLKNINSILLERQAANQDLQNHLQKMNVEVNPLREKAIALENAIHQGEILIAKMETELENYVSRWQEKFDDPIPESDSPMSGVQIRNFKARMQELSALVDELGIVDLGAVKEYEEIEARFDYMHSHYEDLLQARDSLDKLLRDTENIMGKRFGQFLMLANDSFNKTFTEIFSGGEARLLLEKSDERLEAGVDIEVKMPGKKLQSLNLLSGGERALTCIAFIFALLRLKPIPFCLLDEIDAALDETNLTRFTRFLQSMSEQIQFIIITHRQTTIECGDHILGVTMPEKGISRVFTLSLKEAENMAG
ncbi:MAG: chromosome segregation protein SMC [Syntrophomonadaceae bacterium]